MVYIFNSFPADIVIAANAFIIFLGGFETTSSTLAFMFLELAANEEVQEKMREEIRQVEAKYKEITYDSLHELTYMEMVIQETLRLYPPFPTIQRVCTKDYAIPETDVVVEEGTIVVFPILGIHRDEQYFARADAFEPERWREPRAPPPPGVYLPFGDGPSSGLLQTFSFPSLSFPLVPFQTPRKPIKAKQTKRHVQTTGSSK
ncbi:hypothetical protein ACJJTC_005775 [Scirpophaga incertulas]